MVPKEIKNSLQLRMRELEDNLRELKKLRQGITLENLKHDKGKYWSLERGLHLCLEGVFDIAGILISGRELNVPETYKEMILTLGKEGIVPEGFAQEIVGMAHLRNILVHDYLKMDEEIFMDVLHNKLDDFLGFLRYVNRYLGEN
jgi:uncharacterized protein YutE (UPF0331/DUF86 family)